MEYEYRPTDRTSALKLKVGLFWSLARFISLLPKARSFWKVSLLAILTVNDNKSIKIRTVT